MSSKKSQLAGYGTVTIIDEESTTTATATTAQDLNFNESWVEAHVIVPSKLIHTPTQFDVEQVPLSEDEQQQQPQKPVYRDKGFAILFILHLISVLTIGLSYGSWPTDSNDSASTTAETAEDSGYNHKMCTGVIISFITASLLTNLITGTFIPNFANLSVTISIYTSFIINTICLSLFFLTFPNVLTLIVTLLLIIWNVWYTYAVRIFIPFAASNLKLASQAVSMNFGLYFISFIFAFIGLVWVVFWTYTASGVGMFDGVADGDGAGKSHYTRTMTTQSSTSSSTDDYYYYDNAGDVTSLGLKTFSLLLSLYWTINVLANTMQTTIAGVTATYCFDKQNASSCCSSGVISSLYRSCTYSFGSICFGSLLTAIITALRVMAQWARDNSRRNDQNGAALLYCILTCILALIEDIIEYFNQWAYIFVGIWGLDYLESGKRVLELFKARGCTAIISNGLASYVLTNLVILSSLICGIIGYVVVGDTTSFWACFIVGAIVSATMVNIVQSAVKAVIVCYADHPHKLYENHPEEAVRMTNAISRVFPGVPVPLFQNVTV